MFRNLEGLLRLVATQEITISKFYICYLNILFTFRKFSTFFQVAKVMFHNEESKCGRPVIIFPFDLSKGEKCEIVIIISLVYL